MKANTRTTHEMLQGTSLLSKSNKKSRVPPFDITIEPVVLICFRETCCLHHQQCCLALSVLTGIRLRDVKSSV
ncbi:hypothetical protein JAAARDRAFT_496031 [Jaapia argillacea MUCL 33604]|uniref:Uncharacterized protein n=1 Tax=Jaapia argillacea MUCL 33604 TaxID=933084 RepID=A0A067PNJ9_9AGAM|nr:hypothetical protein JAAARDRAFT_496031 [Jaapia argillacea MUCL 33604]